MIHEYTEELERFFDFFDVQVPRASQNQNLQKKQKKRLTFYPSYVIFYRVFNYLFKTGFENNKQIEGGKYKLARRTVPTS